jgi:hypothetical protein
MVMRRDFLYWGLEELNLEACCALKFYPQVEVCNTQIEGDLADKLKEEEEMKAEEFGDSKIARIRFNETLNCNTAIFYSFVGLVFGTFLRNPGPVLEHSCMRWHHWVLFWSQQLHSLCPLLKSCRKMKMETKLTRQLYLLLKFWILSPLSSSPLSISPGSSAVQSSGNFSSSQ